MDYKTTSSTYKPFNHGHCHIKCGGHNNDMDMFQDCNTKADQTITDPILIVNIVPHDLTHVFY